MAALCNGRAPQQRVQPPRRAGHCSPPPPRPRPEPESPRGQRGHPEPSRTGSPRCFSPLADGKTTCVKGGRWSDRWLLQNLVREPELPPQDPMTLLLAPDWVMLGWSPGAGNPPLGSSPTGSTAPTAWHPVVGGGPGTTDVWATQTLSLQHEFTHSGISFLVGSGVGRAGQPVPAPALNPT